MLECQLKANRTKVTGNHVSTFSRVHVGAQQHAEQRLNSHLQWRVLQSVFTVFFINPSPYITCLFLFTLFLPFMCSLCKIWLIWNWNKQDSCAHTCLVISDLCRGKLSEEKLQDKPAAHENNTKAKRKHYIGAIIARLQALKEHTNLHLLLLNWHLY